jgi:hypothetical protein
VSEFDFDAAPGLPEPLPAGERILWQGSPRWGSVAVRILHVRPVALYFAVLLAWSVGSAISHGATLMATLSSGGRVIAFAAVALGLLIGFAHLIARTTLYTITSRRVVMRIGVALPLTINIPFSLIAAAGEHIYPDGTGDFPLTTAGPDRQSLVVLWPHVRPWRTVRPEPMLRCVPDAREVATILAAALKAGANERAPLMAGPAPTPEQAQTPALAPIAERRPSPAAAHAAA